ncbi:MAG: PTS sugar transporter subunit IIA [Spirochaetaceae bacterium]|jgi:PTS system nitrogen regulatory IIA component|nr:PTS sugar transporter subunit IIA [Spirochaetaceae bacterium]
MAQAVSLSGLFRRGGVYYQLPGKLPKEALAALIGLIPDVTGILNSTGPNSVDGKNSGKDKLLQAVLEREELMPTAMGNGIALPHPRNPLIENAEEQFAALAFLENEIDWGALDGKSVHSIIMVVSASAKMHLATLQRITFFCRDENFCSLLKRRAPAEEILALIEKTEQGWN